MYHSFLTHSSADGLLGCCHALAIVNSAALSIGVHVSLAITVSLKFMLSSGIAGFYGNSIPSFLRNLHTVLHSVLLVCTPTDCVRGFPFLYTLSSIYCLQTFWWWPFWLVEMIPHCGFDLHFSNNERSWAFFFFIWLLSISMFSLEKCV